MNGDPQELILKRNTETPGVTTYDIEADIEFTIYSRLTLITEGDGIGRIVMVEIAPVDTSTQPVSTVNANDFSRFETFTFDNRCNCLGKKLQGKLAFGGGLYFRQHCSTPLQVP